MEITRNKRKSKCLRCENSITSKYKVYEWGDSYSHLSCYYKNLQETIKTLKKDKKEFSKKKYRRIMILEGLEK